MSGKFGRSAAQNPAYSGDPSEFAPKAKPVEEAPKPRATRRKAAPKKKVSDDSDAGQDAADE